MTDAKQLSILTPDGVSLIADVWNAGGTGTLLLLPCGGELRDVWRPVVRALPPEIATQWHVVAPDYRGHGDSGRVERYVFDDFLSDLLAWIAHLSARPLVVAGGSIGGALGMVAAGEGAPVHGLVLLDVPTVPVLERALGEATKVGEALRRGLLPADKLDPRFLQSGFVQDVFRDADRWRRGAVRLRIPTLLLAAERGVVGLAQIALYREHVAHGEVEQIQTGHLVARDAPAVTARLISAFLQSHWPA